MRLLAVEDLTEEDKYLFRSKSTTNVLYANSIDNDDDNNNKEEEKDRD